MAPTYRLVMRSGPTPGKEFPLEKEDLTIGRDLSNDIVISDPEMSRRHARMTLQNNTYVLEDLGSTNGTSVNGQRLISPYTLRPGETVGFGEHNALVYELVQADEDATVVASVRPAPVQQMPVMPPPQPAAPPPQASTPPPPAYMPPPPPARPVQPPPAPQYVPQVPSYPSEPISEPPKKKSNALLIIILVVLLLMVCACVGVLWYIDANYLWCNILPFLSGCP